MSDKKYILTFIVCDIEGAVIEPELN
jgi:hypothetical protein